MMTLNNNNQDLFIENLYREMFTQLNIYAQSALRDRSLGEEAVQDTFRIACIKIDELIASSNPKGWLMNTLKNVISNIRRSRARLLRMLYTASEMNEASFGSTHDDIDPEIMYGGIISTEEFNLLKKIVLERYSMLEAAEELGISVEACKKRLQRAKDKFKKKLEE
jgi:RNA polymerase sigma-70 factor (ECF subfamily)